jgi:mono/diheme cytochrome c family protein
MAPFIVRFMNQRQTRSRLVALSFVGASTVALAVLTAGCGGGGGGEEASTTTQASTMTTMTTTTGTTGDVAAGKGIFVSAGCGGCHVFKAAATTGTTGPNLDKHLREHKREEGGALAEHVRESILEPDTEIAEGFKAGVMPSYRTRLSQQQIDDLVAFIVANV